MKTLYTILFFINTIFLIILSLELFKEIDNRAGNWIILLIISGMAICVILLVFFLFRYIRQPYHHKNK